MIFFLPPSKFVGFPSHIMGYCGFEVFTKQDWSVAKTKMFDRSRAETCPNTGVGRVRYCQAPRCLGPGRDLRFLDWDCRI